MLMQEEKAIAEQIIAFLLNNKSNKFVTDSINSIKFGEIKFEVKDGKVYRFLASNSVLVGKDNNATK